MYNALELMQRAFYAAHYAQLLKAAGKDPATMIEAAQYYLNKLDSVDHADFARTISIVEGMLVEVTK